MQVHLRHARRRVVRRRTSYSPGEGDCSHSSARNALTAFNPLVQFNWFRTILSSFDDDHCRSAGSISVLLTYTKIASVSSFSLVVIVGGAAVTARIRGIRSASRLLSSDWRYGQAVGGSGALHLRIFSRWNQLLQERRRVQLSRGFRRSEI